MNVELSLYLFQITFFLRISALSGEEICTGEIFKSKCPQNKPTVLVINSAKYGRMSLASKCIGSNKKWTVGCSADVLPMLDFLCSGRTLCSTHIPNPIMKLMNRQQEACDEDLQSYLQVDYDCIDRVYRCKSTAPSLVVSSDKGNLIASSTNDCKYKLTTPKRRFRLTLLDFTAYRLNRTWSSASAKNFVDWNRRQIEIEEMDKVFMAKINEKRARQVHIYTSRTAQIQIIVRKMPTEYGSFIIQYEAVGCDKLQENNDMYQYEYDEYELQVTITCKSSSLAISKKLLCEKNTWIGEYPICLGEIKSKKVFNMPYSVLISIVISASLILGVIILVCGLVFLQWRRTRLLYIEAARRTNNGTLSKQHPDSTTNTTGRKKRLLSSSSLSHNNQNDSMYNDYSKVDYQQVAPHDCPHLPIYYELDTSSSSTKNKSKSTTPLPPPPPPQITQLNRNNSGGKAIVGV